MNPISKNNKILRDSEATLALLKKALAQKPDNISIQIDIANHYAINKKFLEATMYFRKLLSLMNGSEDIKQGLCFCLNEVGNNYQFNRKFELAKDFFEETLIHYPNNSNYLFNYGNALYSLNKFNSSIIAYQKSIKNNLLNQDADTFNNLANAYL